MECEPHVELLNSFDGPRRFSEQAVRGAQTLQFIEINVQFDDIVKSVNKFWRVKFLSTQSKAAVRVWYAHPPPHSEPPQKLIRLFFEGVKLNVIIINLKEYDTSTPKYRDYKLCALKSALKINTKSKKKYIYSWNEFYTGQFHCNQLKTSHRTIFFLFN